MCIHTHTWIHAYISMYSLDAEIHDLHFGPMSSYIYIHTYVSIHIHLQSAYTCSVYVYIHMISRPHSFKHAWHIFICKFDILLYVNSRVYTQLICTLHTYIQIHTYTYTHGRFLSVNFRVQILTYIHIHTYIHTYTYIHTWQICIREFQGANSNIHTHTYIHTYTYIHTWQICIREFQNLHPIYRPNVHRLTCLRNYSHSETFCCASGRVPHDAIVCVCVCVCVCYR